MRLPASFAPSSRFALPAQHGTWFLFRRRELLVFDDATLPTGRGAELFGLAALRTQYLGQLGVTPCFSAELAADVEAPPGMAFLDLRTLYGRLSLELLSLAGHAVQVMDWDRTHRFCGACGAETRPHERMRARVCTDCGLEHYPRVAPAMIVLVERGLEVLLARSPHFPAGMFSALAGFVDPGESLEECVHREVREETGVRVANLRYFGSQQWPFPHSLMLGFFADYDTGEITPEPGEIEAAAFFHVDALPAVLPSRLSIASQLLAAFCARHGRAYPGS